MNKQEMKAKQAELEELRQQVLEIELKARYWKAHYEIRHYTLEHKLLEDAYTAHMESELKRQQEAMEKFIAEMENQSALTNGEPETAPTELTDQLANQELN